MEARFGPELRRLRQAAGLSLRALARRLEVSAAHLSDLEHDQRRPSEALLRRIVHELRDAGADPALMQMIVTGLDADTRRWATTTPGARALLHRVIATGRTPAEIIAALDALFPDSRISR